MDAAVATAVEVPKYQGTKVPAGAHVHALGWHLADLSDFEFRFIVLGEPAVTKNHKEIVRLPNGRSILALSKAARRFMREATKQLKAQWSSCFREPIPAGVLLNAAICVYLGTLRHTDLSNQYEGPQDALVAAGVLVDDYWIGGHDGSRRYYSPGSSRVEIALTPLPREDPYLPGLAPGLDPDPTEVEF